MESVQWKVEGMTCANCALTINKFLEKTGQSNIRVNPLDGAVSFDLGEDTPREQLVKGIEELGYAVRDSRQRARSMTVKPWLRSNLHRLLFCLPFTMVLMAHMLTPWIHVPLLHQPWVQLIICLPVFVTGMSYFGKSAWQSLRNGMPNMNVLITLGALASFLYSLTGTLLGLGQDFLFYETTATIITLVFLGNYLEERAVASTQKALRSLISSRKVMAHMIAFDENHQELVLPVDSDSLKTGDLILVRTGEQVPADCKILWGEAEVNESLLTGETLPKPYQQRDRLIGGSVIERGTVKAIVTAAGEETVLAGIIRMVGQAQGEKPPMQVMADRISGWFVPFVVAVALITFVINFLVGIPAGSSLMRSVAVLVIACPCAMGLATPAAIAVGLGRAARRGILFRNARGLELFRDIRQVVFDKTGTLTTGKFRVSEWKSMHVSEADFKKWIYSLEKYSTHPLALALSAYFKSGDEQRWSRIEEEKGFGMRATDKDGNHFAAVSARGAGLSEDEAQHHVYLMRNDKILGWVDLQDELRPEAADVVQYLRARGMKTILLSGDRREVCEKVAQGLGIDEVYAEQSPGQKLEKVAALTAQAPTVMVGDGINDAPALARATVGVSLSDATQLALESAQVVLMNHGLKRLPEALGLGKHTFVTIRQNLFWAFLYNIVAIPVAAFGMLTPGFGALVMGLSDVVLAVNSARLYVKKVT